MNNVKISYFQAKIISKIIENYHKKLIDKLYWKNNVNSEQSCYCKISNECSLGNKYNHNNIIFETKI